MRNRFLPILMAVFLILAGVVLRIARHYGWIDLPPNVAPVAAMAMFSAVYLPRRLAVIVPLGLMALSDLVIGWYEPGVMAAVYASFGLSLMLGWWLKRKVTVGRLIGASLFGSIAFFLITNGAVAIFGHGYGTGSAGLLQAYVQGLPFFRNTVLGDLAYSGLFFGLYNAVVVYSTKRVPAATTLTHG